MSYQVLARKWRPKKFQDVIGQEAITRSLQNAIKRGRLGHAYLFTGTRGIGKTSVARLFAQAIRCESLAPDGNPCGICSACEDMHEANSMNVIEIDGASNNGVDQIRELISNVQYLPTNGSYRIYIIDEVHMLSTPAFNALLKTLEEPPKHVIFLLATTEPQKLLGTVLSRCQRFDFVNASVEALTTHILKIAESEGITFESEDLVRDIARLGNGSVRDTLSLLDQVLSYTFDNQVTEEVLAQSLGIAKRKVLDKIIASILDGDASSSVKACRQTLEENVSLKSLFGALLENLFNLIEHIDDNEWLDAHPQLQSSAQNTATAELFWIYESLARETSWLFDSLVPENTFFVLIKKLALRRAILGLESVQAEPSVESKKKVIIPEPEPEPAPKQEKEVTVPKVKAPAALEKAEAPVVNKEIKTIEDLLKHLEKSAPTLAASLEHAELSPSDLSTSDTLRVRYPNDGQVFYDVIAEESSRDRLQNVLNECLKREMKLVIELVQDKANEEHSIKTRAQERKEQDAIDEEDRKQAIMTDPILKMAQEMFNTKVDKIQLSKKGD